MQNECPLLFLVVKNVTHAKAQSAAAFLGFSLRLCAFTGEIFSYYLSRGPRPFGYPANPDVSRRFGSSSVCAVIGLLGSSAELREIYRKDAKFSHKKAQKGAKLPLGENYSLTTLPNSAASILHNRNGHSPKHSALSNQVPVCPNLNSR